MSLDIAGVTWTASSLRYGFKHQRGTGSTLPTATNPQKVKRTRTRASAELLGFSLAIASRHRQRVLHYPRLRSKVRKRATQEKLGQKADIVAEAKSDSKTLGDGPPDKVDKDDGPNEVWLYEMSRREYLRQRIHPELAGTVSDLSDLELYVLGLSDQKDQSETAAKLRGLGTASGCRLLGVPRSQYVDKRVNAELCRTKHALQVSFLSDFQLVRLGTTGTGLALQDQERKLKELQKMDQNKLLGSEHTRKECIETQFAPAVRTCLQKLSDLAVYVLAQKHPKDAKEFIMRLQDLEETLNIQRSFLIKRLDPRFSNSAAAKAELCAIDDVTLKALCEKSHKEQRQWLSEGKSALTAQPHENVAGAKVGSTAQLEKHESAVVQIVAKESSQNRTSTKANGKAADASKTTQDKVPENVEGAKDGSTVQLGKHESAVVQIVAKESKSYKAASSSQNGASTNATGKAADASKTTQDKVPESSEPAADKTLATKQMGKHEENVAQIQANGAAAKIDPQEKPPSKPARKKADSKKALEIAGLESLQSLISRGCRLIAVAVCGELYRESRITRIILRENDLSRPALAILKVQLETAEVRGLVKKILEDPEVLKVVHNCPRVADALKHQHDICLRNVFDTAIAWQLLEEDGPTSSPVSVSEVLSKFDQIDQKKLVAKQKKKKQKLQPDAAEKVLFDVMGMAPAASVSEYQEDEETLLLELKGLLVASIAMSKLLKDQSKIFKQLCQEGLEKFRQWPGQHVESLPQGKEAAFSFKNNKLICHSGQDVEDLKQIIETVKSEQLAEDASAAAELNLLFRLLPKPVLEAVENHWAKVGTQPMELVLSVGRQIEFRCRPLGAKRMRCDFLSHICTTEDVNAVTRYIGDKNFTVQDRAGIDGTLHRISAVRNKAGRVVTLVMRIGRSSRILAGLLEDILSDSKSMLILGPPGVGKTTLLRACAARLSEDRPSVIVDPAGEIAGCGDEPHKSVGRSLKDMAYSRNRASRSEARREAMTRVVENMTPKVLVVDEIGTKQEASAARTIGERGVQLVATAHGHNLFDLLANTELRDLVGGITTTVLGDDNPRVKESGRKTMSERSSRPVFSVLVELQTPFSVAVHADVAESVDAALMGRPIPVQVRSRDSSGQMHVKLAKI